MVRTGALPGLRIAHALAYRQVLARLRRTAPELFPDAQLVLRGSAVSRIEPGISDVDLLVVYRSDLGAEQELRAARAVRRAIRRINVPVPLIREVHGFSSEELPALGRLGSVLYATAHFRGEALAGRFPPGVFEPSARAYRIELLRSAAYWLERAFVQLALEAEEVGRRLAARSLGWVDALCSALEGGMRGGPEELVLARRGRGVGSSVGWPELTRAMGRVDALLGDAPPLRAAFAPLPPPPLDRAARELVEPPLPALRAARLASSLRGSVLHLGVDPHALATPATLRALASRWRRHPHLDVRMSTRGLLERPALANGSAWLGEATARTLHGTPVATRSSRAELAFGIAYTWLKELSRARWRGSPDSDRLPFLRDAAAKLLRADLPPVDASHPYVWLRRDGRFMMPGLVELACDESES